MRKTFIFYALTLFISCHHDNKERPLSVEKNPVIKFEYNSINFGTIKKGDSVSLDFPFKNVGENVLRIVNVQASCSCTVGSYGMGKLSPGAASSIKVKYLNERDGSLGGIEKEVVVRTNCKPSISILRVKGIVQ